MAKQNFFHFLSDDENEDPPQLVVGVNSMPATVKPAADSKRNLAAPDKLSTKSAPLETVMALCSSRNQCLEVSWLFGLVGQCVK